MTELTFVFVSWPATYNIKQKLQSSLQNIVTEKQTHIITRRKEKMQNHVKREAMKLKTGRKKEGRENKLMFFTVLHFD